MSSNLIFFRAGYSFIYTDLRKELWISEVFQKFLTYNDTTMPLLVSKQTMQEFCFHVSLHKTTNYSEGSQAYTANSRAGVPPLVAVYGTGGHLTHSNPKMNNAVVTRWPTSIVRYWYNLFSIHIALRLTV
jgi:hypothetical protein